MLIQALTKNKQKTKQILLNYQLAREPEPEVLLKLLSRHKQSPLFLNDNE